MTDEAKRCVESCREWYIAFSSFGKNNESSVKELLATADLIESLSAELEQVKSNLSELLYYVTGGRFSKADYSTDDMRRFVDDYNQSVCNECDELEHVKRERDAAVEDLEMLADCETCIHDDDEACEHCCDVTTRGNWQWRGVPKEET